MGKEKQKKFKERGKAKWKNQVTAEFSSKRFVPQNY